MSRSSIRVCLMASVVVLTTSAAFAQQGQTSQRQEVPANYAQPKKIIINPNQGSGPPQAIGGGRAPHVGIPPQTGYVQLHAPLYPSPRPNVPYQVGATYITNPALNPHEMLYPHRYRALYPPYYYRVNGQWRSAFGTMRRYERWELHGTEVDVQYCSKKPFLSRLGGIFGR